MRKLYRKYGWPDKFVGEEFQRAREDWNETVEKDRGG
jgi:hypothetical protein